MMYCFRITLFAVFLFFASNIIAQDTVRTFVSSALINRVEANVGVGYHFDIDPKYPPLSNPVFASEFHFSRVTIGRKYWHYLFNHPEIGISLYANTNANERVFGKAIAVIPTFGMRLNKNNKMKLYCRLGLGLGYVEQVFDFIENPTNKVIGTHINIAANAKFFYNIALYKKWSMNAGIQYLHYSNSKLQLPNLGINIASGFVGVRYEWESNKPHERVYARTLESTTSFFLQGRAGIGYTNIIQQGNAQFPIYIGAFSGGKICKQKNKVYFGIEAYKNMAVQSYLNQKYEDDNDRPKALRGAVYIGHEFLFSHIGFVTQCGINVLRGELSRSIVYNKLGFNFYWKDANLHLKNNVYVGLYVHAAAGEAEFPELTVGYIF